MPKTVIVHNSEQVDKDIISQALYSMKRSLDYAGIKGL